MAESNLHEYSQFANKSGTKTALVKVLNDILTGIGQYEIIILILLHLSATFDTIDHDALFYSMESTLD